MAGHNSKKKTKVNNPFGGTRSATPVVGGSVRSGATPSVRGGATSGLKPQTPLPGLSVQPNSINLGSTPDITRNGANPENVWWGQNEGANTLPLIWQLLNNSNNGGSLSQGYADVLAQLQTLMADPHNPVNPDLVMSIFQNLLSYQTTQDQRQYDYTMLQEGRQYNTPTNELARLMGAGISRDAALQILSGSGAGAAGAGSDASQMMGMTGSAGSAAAYGASAQQGQINTIINGLNSFANMVHMGFGVAQSFEQTQMLKNQNYMSQSQIQAYDATGAAYALLNDIGADEKSYSSVSAAASAITAAAKSGNVEAAQFIASGKLAALKRHAPFASKNLSTLYRSENDADLFMSELRQASSQADINEKTVALIGEEISKTQAEYEQIVSNTDYIEQQTKTSSAMYDVYVQQAEYLKKQGKNTDADTLLKAAQRLKVQEETTGLSFTNELTDQWMHTQYAGQTGLEWQTTKTLCDLCRDARVAQKTTSTKFVDATFFSMFNSAANIAAVQGLDYLANRAGIQFARQYPEQFRLWNMLREAGAYDFLNAIANGQYTFTGNTGVTMFGIDFGFKTQHTGNTTVDYLEDLLK